MSSKLGDKKLWNLMANSAQNSIEAGGWFSSYTLLPFSDIEMQEYVEDMERIITRYIDKDSKLLEIGCSSGLTMVCLCPKVKKYIGIDISKFELEWCEKELEKYNLTNFELRVLSAENIDQITGYFHGIILNSVVHCFESTDYLENVIKKSSEMIKKEGFIYIGDVMNLDTKELFLNSLHEYKKLYPNTNTKLSLDNELLVSPKFFYELVAQYPNIKEVEIYKKSGSVENELKKYKYNVILKIKNH